MGMFMFIVYHEKKNRKQASDLIINSIEYVRLFEMARDFPIKTDPNMIHFCW